MNNLVIMNALDAVAGSMASAYVKFSDGTRYRLMQLYEFEASVEVNNVEVPILGRTGKGNKPAGWKGSWSGTAHYNQPVFRRLLLEYKNTGIMPVFEIQVANEDPTSSVGRQTVVLKDCLLNGGTLAKFDADSDILDEDIEGTFDDFEIPEMFSELNGVRA